MTLRRYDHNRDLTHVKRLYNEAGWFEGRTPGVLDTALPNTTGYVALLHDEAECYVGTMDSVMQHLQTDLPTCCIASVVTSRVARRQKFGLRLTARALAEDVKKGAILATLGIFDQGYYDKLGFGNGGPMRLSTFDPTQLLVEPASRAPVRLSKDDWEEMHALRLKRLRRHGGCNVLNPMITRGILQFSEHAFGLGFRDEATGELTHCFWCKPNDVIHGPYYIWWMAYQTYEQFLELLGLLKTLGDQVYGVRMADPAGIPMQSLLEQPFRHRSLTDTGSFSPSLFAWMGWQARICDLKACLATTHLPCAETLRFNLELGDPIERYLDVDEAWRGIGGEYIVTLGRESSAARGSDPKLPTLRTTVNAFTKLWFGAQAAGTLAVTDEIEGPADLIAALDRNIILPPPHPDWDY
jgi:hypothetical protein